MIKFDRNLVEERKKLLPPDLRAAIDSVDLMQELTNIARERRLHVDEAGALADLIELTLCGLSSAKEFVASLSDVVPSASPDERLRLAEEVNKRIMSKVRDAMRSLSEKEKPTETVEVSAKVTAASRDASYVNTDPSVKVIPSDIKPAGSDPYREPIE